MGHIPVLWGAASRADEDIGPTGYDRVMLSGSEASVFPVLLRHGKTPSVSFADSSLKEGANGFFGFASE